MGQTTPLSYMVGDETSRGQLGLYTSLQNFLSVGGSVNEPGLSICTRANQRLLAKRMAWKFNRTELSGVSGNFLVTQSGQQDMRFAGASIFALFNDGTGSSSNGTLPYGGAGIDLASSPINGGVAGITVSGGVITVQTIDPHPFQTGNVGVSTLFISGAQNPAFNSLFTFNTLLQSCAWTNGYALVGVPDNQHIQLTATTQQVATITDIAKSGTIITITCTNAMSTGDIMSFSGLTTNTVLNGQSFTLISATASTISFTDSVDSITDGSETGTVTATASGAPGITDWGWMESASIVDINSTSYPQAVEPIDATHRLAPEWTNTGDEMSFAMMIDYGNGVLKFRMAQPLGTYCYQLNCVYQRVSPKYTSTSQIFQWPDELLYVLTEVCLWEAFRFAKGISAAETQLQMQSAMQSIQMALEAEDKESNTMGMSPQIAFMR